MDYLDEGVLTEILIRLPAKSLLRFKCVSRLWHSVISDPAFAEAQLRMSLQGNPNPSEKLLVPAYCEGHLYNLDESIFTRLDDRVTQGYGDLYIVGSCHGLVCLRATGRRFFVYNPTTRELRQLPMSDRLRYPNGYKYLCGFGYDSLKDDYKLPVRCRYWPEKTKLVEIYSLRSNSWRSITKVNDYHLLDHGRYSNGFLHWVTRKSQGDTIVSFDIAAEEFREAMLPMPPFRLRHGYLHLSVTGGGSLIVYRIDPPKAEVWIMKDCGLNSTWSELWRFSNEEFVKDSVMHRSDYISPLTKDGKTLVLVRRDWSSFDLYDPKDGFLKTFELLYARYETTAYVESLVSVEAAGRPPKKARLSI